MQIQSHQNIRQVAIVTQQEKFYQRYKDLLESHSFTISKISRQDLRHSISQSNYDLLIIDNEQKSSKNFEIEKYIRQQISPCHIISIGRKVIPELNHGTLCISLPSNTRQIIFDQIISVLEKVNLREKNQLELASMLLHDIRSPLNSLVGYLELLINGTFGKLPNGHTNIVEKAIDMSDYALDLIEELSEVFKFEQKFFAVQKESINFSEMLDTLLAMIWIKADQKNLKIKRSIPEDIPPISGDDFQIQRLTSNILLNAINHTPQNSTISIQVKTNDKKFARISVTDDGEGVPEDRLPLLFDKYYRLQHNSSPKSGQGLGLYICRIITEAHGGKIWAENNQPKGLTIHFTLPLEL